MFQRNEFDPIDLNDRSIGLIVYKSKTIFITK